MTIATLGFCCVSILGLAVPEVFGPIDDAPVRQPPPQPRADPAEGEILLEWVAGRETVPSSDRDTLRLGPPGGKRSLTWGAAGEKSIPLEELLFLKLSGVASRAAPVTFFLRDGSELLGSIPSPGTGRAGGDPGDKDSVFVHAPGLSSTPVKLAIDSLRGLLVHDPFAMARKVEAPTGQEAGNKDKDDKDNDGAAAPVSKSQPKSPRAASSKGLAGHSSGANVRLRNEILRSVPPKDVLVFLEEGRAQGVLDSITPEGVKFSSEGLGDVRVGFDKLRAVILSELGEPGKKPAPKTPGVGLARALLRDGSCLEGVLTEIQGGTLSIAPASLGLQKLALKDVVEIAFLGGRLSYLSDRDPVRVDERLPAAYTANARPYQRDLSVQEGPLKLGGREFRKGLGVHSYSLLEYDLGGSFSRFQSTIGLDESARPTGSRITGTEGFVIFRVRLDGKLLFEKPMSWRDPGEAVDLGVASGKILSLEVDCGKPGDASSVFNFALDRADWAEARLIQ